MGLTCLKWVFTADSAVIANGFTVSVSQLGLFQVGCYVTSGSVPVPQNWFCSVQGPYCPGWVRTAPRESLLYNLKCVCSVSNGSSSCSGLVSFVQRLPDTHTHDTLLRVLHL